MPKKKEVKNSENESDQKSEDWLRFKNGLKAIFSLTPEQAKAIRKSKPARKLHVKKRKTN